MTRHPRSSRRIVVALCLAIFGLASSTAQATPIVLGPWAGNHILCTAARCPQTTSAHGTAIVNRGNLIGFWQNVVSSDGYGSVCTANGIDGQFGSRSESNTKAWQAAFDLPGVLLQVDGIVGPHTWSAAYTFMVFEGHDGEAVATQYWHYNGAVRDIPVEYYFQDLFWALPSGPTGAFYQDSDHPTIGFSPC
jgi:hypothetical protein